jgi:hypothetical protein
MGGLRGENGGRRSDEALLIVSSEFRNMLRQRRGREGEDLSGANLSKAKHLTQERLAKTRTGDEFTLLPPTLKPPAHWGVKTDEQPEVD